ncbi:MAG: HIT family protein [Desulfuromonadaceae bacterium]
MTAEQRGFSLDPRLAADCTILGSTGECELLLLNNRIFRPWFILVPYTREEELIDLEPEMLHRVMQHMAELSRFVRREFHPDKINTATIGNVVSQLHIHIIARYHNDPCWPAPVWGYTDDREAYPAQEVNDIVSRLKKNTALLVD